MKLWRLWTRAGQTLPETSIDPFCSGISGTQKSRLSADEAETALEDTLAWLASATRSDSALIDRQRASRQLEARIAAESLPAPSRLRSRTPRRSYRWQWQALALAAVAAGIVGLLLRGQMAARRPTPARVEVVRFDPSLWELDDLTAVPVGNDLAGMSRLFRR